MKLEFRHAQMEDLHGLVLLLADDALGATREDSSPSASEHYRQAFLNIDADKNNELIVAELEGELAGLVQLTFIPYLTHQGSSRCLVEGVRVASGMRGRGVGKKLLGFAVNRATERGCSIIQLTTDKKRPEAIEFYESLGFVGTHVGFKLSLQNSETS